MTIDLRTTHVEPLRRNFDHIAARIGDDKPASRYQEGVWGLQPAVNFHYRPTWDPAHELYDPTRTAIVMRDFDDLVDPRQYYYGTWTMQRARQQESQEKNFEFVEKRGLLAALDDAWRVKLVELVLPLRHVAWAGNTNNASICAYGFGAPLTSAAAMHMMDELGVAQYLSRAGLLLADNEPRFLDDAKRVWMTAPMWQPLRAAVELSMTTQDWFELFVAQNLVIDGLVHPLVFDRFDRRVAAAGGAGFSLLNEFVVDWYAESSRWVDAMVKLAAAESADNAARIVAWASDWRARIVAALAPLAEYGFGADGAAMLAEVDAALVARAARLGVTLEG